MSLKEINKGNFYYFDLEIAPNGKILATGAEAIPLLPSGLRTGGHLFRLNTDGTPDLRFGRGGYSRLSSEEYDVSFVASRIRDGRISTLVFQSENHFGFFGMARHHFAK